MQKKYVITACLLAYIKISAIGQTETWYTAFGLHQLP